MVKFKEVNLNKYLDQLCIKDHLYQVPFDVIYNKSYFMSQCKQILSYLLDIICQFCYKVLTTEYGMLKNEYGMFDC